MYEIPDLGEAASFRCPVFQPPLNSQGLLVVGDGIFLSTQSIVAAADQKKRPGLAGAVALFAPDRERLLQGVDASLRRRRLTDERRGFSGKPFGLGK